MVDFKKSVFSEANLETTVQTGFALLSSIWGRNDEKWRRMIAAGSVRENYPNPRHNASDLALMLFWKSPERRQVLREARINLEATLGEIICQKS